MKKIVLTGELESSKTLLRYNKKIIRKSILTRLLKKLKSKK
jgi:hypothetical protein